MMKSSVHLDISIIIITKDRRKYLKKTLTSLKKLNFHKAQYEIVVVEEADDPQEISEVKYVLIPRKNKGFGCARNTGLAHATGEIIVFLDDDCEIHNGWLEKLLDPFKDDSVGGVQGGVTVSESTNPIGWAESILGFPGGGVRRIQLAKGKVQETSAVSTLNCAYRKQVLDKVGGFEEGGGGKLGSEDELLAKQACNHARCLFVPDALVNHESRGSLIKIWHWFVRRGRAELKVIGTNRLKNGKFWLLFRRSLTIKMIILIAISVVFLDWIWFWIVFAALAYSIFQYVRYYNTWRISRARPTALLLLPLVKLTMDLATDWGRFRGILFG
ncbi:hypothetical protein D1AOALGA4SA_12739 [Olavius algarvensis Delta 1 endosymbiont]|nr:hypothetical protein D1AOALGA4SA_12739 [Olavius algarvensis Delta 1 endosymbiont]